MYKCPKFANFGDSIGVKERYLKSYDDFSKSRQIEASFSESQKR